MPPINRLGDKGQVANYILVVIASILAILLFQFAGISPKILMIMLGLAVFVVAFFKIDFALIILIFSMLLSPEFSVGGIPGRDIVLRIDDILLFTVFLGWLAKMAINKELGLLKSTPLNGPIIAYILICVLSTLIGGLRGTTNVKHGAFYILKYIEYFVIFFMVSNNIRDRKQIKTFLFFMFFTCFIVSVYGMKVGLSGARATAPFEGRDPEPNTLAGYLLLMMGIAIGILLYKRSLKLRIILGGYLVLLASTFLYTLSRGGWLGFFPMYMTSMVLSKRNKELLILLVIGILATAPFIFPQTVFKRAKSTFVPGHLYRKEFNIFGERIYIDDSAAIRIESWNRSLRKWSKSPIIGSGVPAGGVVSDVQYGRILREVGIVGFAAFIWIVVALFKVAWRSFSDPEVDELGKGLSLGFMSGLAGLLVMAAAAEVFIIVRIMEPFWFLAAMVVALPEISRAAPKEESVPETV